MLHGKNKWFLGKLAITIMMACAICFAVASCATTAPTQTNAKTEQARADLAKALGCPTWANREDERGGVSASRACIMAALGDNNKALAGVNSTMGLATRAASSSSAIAAAGRVSEAASAVAP